MTSGKSKTMDTMKRSVVARERGWGRDEDAEQRGFSGTKSTLYAIIMGIYYYTFL